MVVWELCYTELHNCPRHSVLTQHSWALCKSSHTNREHSSRHTRGPECVRVGTLQAVAGSLIPHVPVVSAGLVPMLCSRGEIAVCSLGARLVDVKVGWGMCKHKVRRHCSAVKRQPRPVTEDSELASACVLGARLEC